MNYLLFFSASVLLLSCNTNTHNKKNEPPIVKGISQIDLQASGSCNYKQDLPLASAYTFSSDAEAENALKRILKPIGIPQSFILKAADVDNACAVISAKTGVRYILYNQLFMKQVKNQTHNDYAAISILAHEVGHHLAGHTLLNDDSRPQLELEADRFSGFVLQKMGASLSDALVAVQNLIPEEGSPTHPGRRSRLAAITNGWTEASESQTAATQKTEIVTPQTAGVLYQIHVPITDGYITIRNRCLSPDEFRLASGDSQEANKLNDQTFLGNLDNGTPVEVLSSVGKTYYVRVKVNGGMQLGYIVKTFKGLPTITRMKSEVKH